MYKKPLHIILLQILVLLKQTYSDEFRYRVPSQANLTSQPPAEEGGQPDRTMTQFIHPCMPWSHLRSSIALPEMNVSDLVKRANKSRGKKKQSCPALKDVATKKTQREAGNNSETRRNKTGKSALKCNQGQIKKHAIKRQRPESCTFEINPAPVESRPVIVDAMLDINAAHEADAGEELAYAEQEKDFFCHVTDEEMFRFDSCGSPTLAKELEESNGEEHQLD